MLQPCFLTAQYPPLSYVNCDSLGLTDRLERFRGFRYSQGCTYVTDKMVSMGTSAEIVSCTRAGLEPKLAQTLLQACSAVPQRSI